MPLFSEDLPQWDNTGTEPSGAKKTAGWLANEKPPAEWFNWLFNRIYKCIDEIRTFITNNLYVDPLTTRGDMLYRNASNVTTRLPLGATGKALTSNGTDLEYNYPEARNYIVSNTVILTANTERSVSGGTDNVYYSTGKSFVCKYSGSVRIKYEMRCDPGGVARFSTNGSSNMGETSSSSYVAQSVDVSVTAGVVYTMYLSKYNVASYIRNVTICGSVGFDYANAIVD